MVPGGKGQLVIQTRQQDEETEEEQRDRRAREKEEAAIRRAREDRAGGKRKRGKRGQQEEEKKAAEAEEKEEEEERKEGPVASHPPLTSLSYTGVGIKVSFASGSTAATHQLSGGQESVVALSLIFAIQRCDPSPFYLFDEIDSALDPVHRASVAAMIRKQKEGAQFICTTFSGEMIEEADQTYGVVFQNKVSKVRLIDKDEAMQLVRISEQEQQRGDDEGGQDDD
jgi:ABC-type glutathione transport system ATPase component